MSRPRLLLPLVTTSLPFIAGTVPVLHGAFAGLLAIASPLLVDLALALQGDLTWRADTAPEPEPAASRYTSALFYVYASGFLFFFARFVLTSASLPLVDVVGRAFSWIVLSGVPTLIVGHALIHHRSKISRNVGQALFSSMNYPDFPRLHIEGHHRHVATGADDHSAEKDLSFYRFFFRCLAGELVSVPRASSRARGVVLAALQVLAIVVVGAVGGPRALVVFFVTTFLSRGVVALVNYVQHYGLERRPGQKVGVDHAWDLPYKSGNWLYFNAGFHADHHMLASAEPSALTLRSTRFVLPHNIPVILPLALVPGLFFRTMNPRLSDPERAPSAMGRFSPLVRRETANMD